ncbi:Metallo-dependent phosphatase [Coemansia spiralis]|nr:Metallo-dependent phosphatase [Coemansia spiralis]
MRLYFIFCELLLLIFSAQDTYAIDASSLRIIHTNDIHAHYSSFNKYGGDCSNEDKVNGGCYGGAARLVTIVNQLRSGHPNTLLFDAGDQAQGTLFYTVGKFNTTIKVMNQLKYDAMCLGNHEFDDGPDFLAGFLEKLSFPAVSANIDTTKNANLARALKPYIVINKYKLGVIGYITNTTDSISNAGPTVSFTDAASAVNKYVDELRGMGIKRIIAVSHNGYHEDIDVAARTRGLDIIVGGHSHTYLSLDSSEPGAGGPYPTKVKNTENKDTFVVQAKAWGEYVGYVDVEFNDDGSVKALAGEPIHMTESIPEDAEMAANVQRWRQPFEKYGDTVVGNITASLTNSGCKERECGIGDLTADAMLWSFSKIAHADIAFINGGGIRAGIRAGTVMVKDLLLVFPFGDSLVTFDIAGKDLEQVIKGVYQGKNIKSNKPVGSTLQVAGMRIKYKSTSTGNRAVKSIEIANKSGWMLVDPNKVYKAVTVEYIAKGGDNIIYPAIEAPPLEKVEEAVEKYFKQFSPINPALAGRLVDGANSSA